MIYFYGKKEDVGERVIDSFASSVFKEVIPNATVVYTDDAEIAKLYKGAGVEVKPITVKKTRKRKVD